MNGIKVDISRKTLWYADCTVLIASSEESLQPLLDRIVHKKQGKRNIPQCKQDSAWKCQQKCLLYAFVSFELQGRKNRINAEI